MIFDNTIFCPRHFHVLGVFFTCLNFFFEGSHFFLQKLIHVLGVIFFTFLKFFMGISLLFANIIHVLGVIFFYFFVVFYGDSEFQLHLFYKSFTVTGIKSKDKVRKSQ